MDTVSIRSAAAFSLKSIEECLGRRWPVEQAANRNVVVHGSGSRVYIHPCGECPGNRLLLDYSDVSLVKAVLETIADNSSITVDNDFGLVLPGDEFVRKCRSDKDWDWRR